MEYIVVDSPEPPVEEVEDEGQNKDQDVEVDNSKSVLTKIANIYADQLMSDLVLEVGGVQYPAHRLILCASSEVFQVMLMKRDWTEWRESHIVLQETPAASAVFPSFLKYFYTGQIRISHQTVLPILSLADKYNIKDLVSLCLCYMSNHIAPAAQKGQLVSWMQYTMACGHNRVAKACLNYIKWNLEWVWDNAQFVELEGDMLVSLLQQNDLVVLNEMTVYFFVERWLKHQRERLTSTELSETEQNSHWESLLIEVYAHVRFPMMCPKQLAQLLLMPLTQTYKEFFMERLAIAMSYQSGQFERVAEIQKKYCERALFTPRLYTEDPWGHVLAVENFYSLPCYHTSGFIFPTRPDLADATSQDRWTEWTLDLYPKGVWFKKSMMIVWSGNNCDVPEAVLRTVRISITCQNPPECTQNEYGEVIQDKPDIRVKIGILVWGTQHGVEHITSVVERVHWFSAENRVLNIDGVLDFDELNTPLYTPSSSVNTSQPPPPKMKCPNCNTCCDVSDEPKHLLGPCKDQLKIQIVIMPLNRFCHFGPTDVVHV